MIIQSTRQGSDPKENLRVRISVFIDASNLWQAQKVRGSFLDFEKLKNYIKNKYSANSITVFYYTAYPANGTRDYDLNGKHAFYTYLKKGLGFIVQKKELKRITVHSNEGDIIKEKGNMDVEMTIDIIHTMNDYDIAVVFSGDSDFLALISYVRRTKKKVYVFSSKNNISEELRTGSDGYIDILKIEDDIWGRKLSNRKE